MTWTIPISFSQHDAKHKLSLHCIRNKSKYYNFLPWHLKVAMQIFIPVVPLQYEMTGYLLNKLVGNYKKKIKKIAITQIRNTAIFKDFNCQRYNISKLFPL